MNEAQELLPVIRWYWQGLSVKPGGEEVKCPRRLNQQQGRRAAFGILAANGWASIEIHADDRLVVMEARKPGPDKDDLGPQVAMALHAIGWPMTIAGHSPTDRVRARLVGRGSAPSAETFAACVVGETSVE